jgi:hypothetical protein
MYITFKIMMLGLSCLAFFPKIQSWLFEGVGWRKLVDIYLNI